MLRHINLLLLLLTACCGTYAQNAASPTVFYEVNADYIDSCEIGRNCPAIVIKRASVQDEVMVHFPIGGTQTDVYLYAGDAFKSEPIRHDRRFIGEGRPVFDLTDLADAEYRCALLACGLGGHFTLILQTGE